MSLAEYESFFFRRRWPNGFECPRCGHGEYYLTATRRLPLYECRLCGLQTTVTSGTVMDRSRTPLGKWVAVIEVLSSTSGVNAKQLADRVGVTHKTAWLMLRKFRRAIGLAEAGRKLYGNVHAGLETVAPWYLFLFLPDRRFRKERVVFVAGSVGTNGNTTALKIGVVKDHYLVPGTKELTREGEERLFLEHVHSHSVSTWLNPVRMYQSSLRECLRDAKRWINYLFNGIGTKYLQSYLDEYCFRRNAAATGRSLRDGLYEAIVSSNMRGWSDSEPLAA